MPHPFRFALAGFCLASALLLSACDSSPATPAAPSEVDVLTQAFTRGAALDTLGTGTAPAAFALYSAIDASQTRKRAGALARHIVAVGAPIVGVQELLTVRTQYPSDGGLDADRLRLDALALLLDSLDAQGARYRVASAAEVWDTELAAGRPDGPRFDLRLTESVAVLVADSLVASAGPSLRFSGAPLGASALRAPAGAATARVLLGDVAVVVASVRFSASADIVQAQAAELREALGGDLPVVVLGGTASGTVPSLDGLGDAWTMLGSTPGDGATCCFDDVRAPVAFDQRADAVWLGPGAEAVRVELATPAAPSDGGTWTSGRAGVQARVRIGVRL